MTHRIVSYYIDKNQDDCYKNLSIIDKININKAIEQYHLDIIKAEERAKKKHIETIKKCFGVSIYSKTWA